MFQPTDHGMKCVMSHLTLELCLLVMQVETPNSAKARGTVVNVIELGLGVIVLVARESNSVISKDERSYFFVCMLKKAGLYLFNASSCHQYAHAHNENKQFALMWVLAKGDMALDEGPGGAKMIEAVEEKIKGALNLGNTAVWSILVGVSQLTDEDAFTLEI